MPVSETREVRVNLGLKVDDTFHLNVVTNGHVSVTGSIVDRDYATTKDAVVALRELANGVHELIAKLEAASR